MLLYSLMVFYITLHSSFGIKIEDISKHLGTRTPYRFRYNKEDSNIKYPRCKDKKIWMVVRHGTRLPSAKDILGMNSVLKDLKHEILIQHRIGKGPLSSEQLDNLEKWSNNLEIEEEKFLTYEGQNEMILLAERMQKRFPNAIRKEYNNKTFEFRYTATQRAQQSARYFTVGLFDKKISQQVVFAPATKIDMVLRFYKHCDKWQKQVKKNSSTYKEQKIFGNSELMNKTIESVSQRLGLNRTLSLDTVVLMFKICGYETSWRKNHLSPWCYGFDRNGAEVLEYYLDLKHYWLDGYGYNLTSRQACMLMKNLFEKFSGDGPNATFLFAHSGTLLKLLTHIEMYKTRALKADTMDIHRTWRTSDIDCFASNLAFVLYKCEDGDYVLTLHQERIIKLPMCDKELCPLNTLWDYFKDSINNCDIGDICRLD